MIVARSILLFLVAALFDRRRVAGLEGLARAPRPVVDRGRCHRAGRVRVRGHLQPDPNFGRILAAYGGVFVAGSLASGTVVTSSGPTGSTSSAH